MTSRPLFVADPNVLALLDSGDAHRVDGCVDVRYLHALALLKKK